MYKLTLQYIYLGFLKRKRRILGLSRDPLTWCVVGLLFFGLIMIWSLLIESLLLWWSENKTLQRNIQLLTILEKFPKQFGTNFTDYQLNVGLSNIVPLDRDVPDTRPEGCHIKRYDTGGVLPTVTVIIPFYNEAWSMLLRSIHSVIGRSPPDLLHEVILVDDSSDYDYLKQPLFEYISVLSPKIWIMRNDKREGLIRSRQRAARVASGDVLIFLDAHIECNKGWLLPLLDVIRNSRSTIAIPHLDNIMPNDIEYRRWRELAQGGFQWSMEYIWKSVSNRTTERESGAANYKTATTIGCAFGVDRDYFWELGGFDEDMYIWGGENLEMSFRTWMCGGSMLIVPCSRVGHMFRKWLPYSFPDRYGGRYVKFRNYQRVADVWLDQYQKYYYAAVGGEMFYSKEDLESLSRRMMLKRRLKCKSFAWYLKTLLPDLLIPDTGAQFYGQFKNLGGNSCTSSDKLGTYGDLPVTYCGKQTSDQMFTYMEVSKQITHQGECLTAYSKKGVTLTPCKDFNLKQKWFRENATDNDLLLALHPEAGQAYRKYYIVEAGSVLCLTHVNVDNLQILGLLPCSDNVDVAPFQYWSFTLEFDFQFAQSVLDNRKGKI